MVLLDDSRIPACRRRMAAASDLLPRNSSNYIYTSIYGDAYTGLSYTEARYLYDVERTDYWKPPLSLGLVLQLDLTETA